MRRNHRKHGRVTENETAVRELFDISKLNNQSAVTTALLSKPLLSPPPPIISASTNSVVLPVLRGKRAVDHNNYQLLRYIQYNTNTVLFVPKSTHINVLKPFTR